MNKYFIKTRKIYHIYNVFITFSFNFLQYRFLIRTDKLPNLIINQAFYNNKKKSLIIR